MTLTTTSSCSHQQINISDSLTRVTNIVCIVRRGSGSPLFWPGPVGVGFGLCRSKLVGPFSARCCGSPCSVGCWVPPGECNVRPLWAMIMGVQTQGGIGVQTCPARVLCSTARDPLPSDPPPQNFAQETLYFTCKPDPPPLWAVKNSAHAA